jgi:hypothetical protein
VKLLIAFFALTQIVIFHDCTCLPCTGAPAPVSDAPC